MFPKSIQLPQLAPCNGVPLVNFYRPDIDGLRGLSVLSVLLFHAGIPGFSGGYIGVDVFFVISGFLISSIIQRETDNKSFSIFKFYERRIRRIFPALFPVLLFSLLCVVSWYHCVAIKSFAKSLVSTTLFSSNLLFWRESGYFDAVSTTKPLLHMWSLAVEEQFYIFFPALILVLEKRSKLIYITVLIIIMIASFILCLFWTQTHHSAAFYLMPSRAWEILVGALISTRAIPQPKTALQRNILSLLGLFLIAFSVTTYSDITAFPGMATIPPVLGTGLILHCGISSPSAINRYLSWKPIVYLGLISYSLYLWHWPLLVFMNNLVARDLTPLEGAGLLFIAIGVSALSLKFIETPFRRNNSLLPKSRHLFLYSAATMGFACTTGIFLYLMNGIPSLHPKQNAVILASIDEREREEEQRLDVAAREIMSGKDPANIGNPDASPVFILWGDSHARLLAPALSYQAASHKLSGFVATQSSHPPILGVDGVDSNGTIFCDHNFNNAVLAFIARHPHIRVAILAAAWESYANGHHYKQRGGVQLKLRDVTGQSNVASNPALLREGLAKTVATLLTKVQKVILVSDTPDIGCDPINAYWSSTWRGQHCAEVLPTLGQYRARNSFIFATLDKLAMPPRVQIVFPEKRILNDKTLSSVVVNDHLLYRDAHHLTRFGATYVAPAFDDVFNQMVAMARE